MTRSPHPVEGKADLRLWRPADGFDDVVGRLERWEMSHVHQPVYRGLRELRRPAVQDVSPERDVSCLLYTSDAADDLYTV